MSRRFVIAGTTGNTFDIFMQDATATNGAGLINVTTAINAGYRAGSVGKFTTFALTALSSADVAWASGGLFQHSSVSCPGLYRLDVPDAAFASTPFATIFLSSGSGGTNLAPVVFDVHIVSSSATAGDLNVNVGKINNISATSVSAVKNNIGLDTIPTNFGSLAISSSGEVNVKTNNDKSGYSLTQAFPANFSALSITSSGEQLAKLSSGTGAGQIVLTNGQVTVAANNDKTGYSLSQTFPSNFSSLLISSSGKVTLEQAFPSNFASLAISSSGEVTVGTNHDKTGYSLSQTFPSNFSSLLISSSGKVTLEQAFPSNFNSLAISSSGEVTVGTNHDKTGYSLSQTFPSNFSSMLISSSGEVTAGTVGDKTGYALSTAAYNSVADTLLDRDMSAGVDSGTSSHRTPREAFRFLRNKWAVSGGALTVYKEDDVTASWTGTVSTSATADPIIGNDPA